MEHTIGLMIQRASQKDENAMMEVQQLVESGTIKETSTGYKYLVIENKENVNDNQDENV